MPNQTSPSTTPAGARNSVRSGPENASVSWRRPRALSLVAALSLLLVACADNRPYVWGSKLPPEAAESRPLAVGDKVQIVVFGQDAMSGEYEIRPSGEIVVPMIGSFAAAGRTSADMSRALAERLASVYPNARVTVVPTLRRNNVNVLGEVASPGAFEMKDGDGLLAVLARAGGLTEFADRDKIFVLRRSVNPPRIRFRYADLTGADPQSLAFKLRDGDVIVVE
jgi:polysaccharide export outer membrane protein